MNDNILAIVGPSDDDNFDARLIHRGHDAPCSVDQTRDLRAFDREGRCAAVPVLNHGDHVNDDMLAVVGPSDDDCFVARSIHRGHNAPCPVDQTRFSSYP